MSQQALIRETILGMNRRLTREKDGLQSSDNELPSSTNRQNKLKRRAQFYHEGELGGRMNYRRKVEHAGYNRYILRHNPRRYDEEGYELESEDEDEEADREIEDKNPYSGIRIEEMLGPLTHIKDLQHHPAMSLAYKSESLPNMIRDTLEMVHRERKMLVDVKQLLEPLRGDQGWIPAGSLEREDDTMLFGTELQEEGIFATVDQRPFRDASNGDAEGHGTDPELSSADDTANREVDKKAEAPKDDELPNGEPDAEPQATEALKTSEDTVMGGTPAAEEPAATPAAEEKAAARSDTKHGPKSEGDANTDGEAPTPVQTADPTEPTDVPAPNVPQSSNPPTPSAISSPSTSPPRMLTRRRAAATNGSPNGGSRSASPNAAGAGNAHPAESGSRSPSPPPLHPLYLTAQSAGPDKDIGLPAAEAEDLRRLLSAYAQKQEEVCRSADRLHRGLLKARRLRDTVWWWARAEEHRGEMSDGEDWVDLEEWRLEAPLRKGNETGVDEAAAEQQAALGIAALSGKKTRGRRVAA